MPTYQYACTACGENLEVVQSFTDAALTECPACNGALRKVFSAVGVVFKGSGFYKTDSRSAAGDKKSETKSEAKSEAKSETKSETKSESTSDAKSAPKTDSKPAAKSESKGAQSTPAA